MKTLNLGIHLEGEDADIDSIEAWMKGVTPLTFPQMANLLQKVTAVQVTEQTIEQQEGTYVYPRLVEVVLYEPPSITASSNSSLVVGKTLARSLVVGRKL